MTPARNLRTGRRVLLVVAILAASAASSLPAAGAAPRPNSAPAALQQAVQQLVNDGVPGAMALERVGSSTWRAAAGVANLATGEPMSPYDRYRIGSVTKSFVSTVVLQLEAEHRLSLADPVEHWLPGVVPNGSNITIRELLNHTSGIPDYITLSFVLQLLHDPLRHYTPLELVDDALQNPPVFAPGAGWAYSNTDYILLGMIIAAADHVNTPPLQSLAPPAETLARIVAPLGLLHTSWPVADPDIHGLHTHGYLINAPAVFNVPPVDDTTVQDPSWGWSAGAIISTLDDVATFHRALFAGHLLPAQQQQELLDFVPVRPGLDYGLGVFRLQLPCGPALGHDGDALAGYTVSLTSPDGSRQFVIYSNEDSNSFTAQEGADLNAALITGFCGQAPTAAAARSVTRSMNELHALELAG